MSERALSGVRVLDASVSYTGALVAMLLADQGAEVVRVVRKDEVMDASFTTRGKRLVVCSDAGCCGLRGALASRADVVIEDARAGDVSLTRHGAGLPEHVIQCWVPPFALDDPLADTPGLDGVVEAAAGMHEVPLGRKPSYTSLSALSVTAANYALNGVMAALLARERDGVGQRVVVPRMDAAYALLELNAMFTVSPPKSWPALQWAATPFIAPLPTLDGRWIYVHAGLAHHLKKLVEVIQAHTPREAEAFLAALSDVTREDPSSVPTLAEARALRQALHEVFRARTCGDWEAYLSEAGLCAAPVLSPDEWAAHPHARESGQLVEVDGALMPGVQAILSEQPGRAEPARVIEAEHVDAVWEARTPPTRAEEPVPHPPLEGVRVLDLSQVIAGPTAGRTLAELGATVHRVENPRFNAPWVEPFHIAFNAGKTSEIIDLTTDRGRAQLDALLAEFRPDVILHNFRPGAPEAMGIGEAEVREQLPAVIYAHLTAYGTTGPWGDRPGWEQTAQAATGVQWTYGGESGPELYPLPFNDLNTGLLGAFAIQLGLYARVRHGVAQRVEVSLSSTSTLVQARTLCDGAPRVIGKHALGVSALHRFYRARDGWLFLCVDPTQVDALARVAGMEGIIDPTKGAGVGLDAARVAHLSRVFPRRSVRTWMELVRLAGVDDRVVIVPRHTHRQVLGQKRARVHGLVKRRAHRGVGEVTETGAPLTLSRTPVVAPEPAPFRPDLSPSTATAKEWLRKQGVGVLSLALSRRDG